LSANSDSYLQHYPVTVIKDWEWDQEKEVALQIPAKAKFIQIRCMSRENAKLPLHLFEFVGYWSSKHKSKELVGSSTLSKLTLPPAITKKQNTIVFSHTSAFCPGFITWLGKDEGKKYSWTNPYLTLNLTLSHALHKPAFKKENVINIHTGVVTYWGGSVPIWFSVDLGVNKKLNCNYYSLRHGYNAANSFPLNIILEGSNDNKNWTVLNTQIGSAFTKAFDTQSFPVKTTSFFRYFRVTQPGNYGMGTTSGAGSPYFCVSGFELYGTLTSRTDTAPPAATVPTIGVKKDAEELDDFFGKADEERDLDLLLDEAPADSDDLSSDSESWGDQ